MSSWEQANSAEEINLVWIGEFGEIERKFAKFSEENNYLEREPTAQKENQLHG
jgi:hypothetical protein